MPRHIRPLLLLAALLPGARLGAQNPACTGPLTSSAPLTANQASILVLHCGEAGRERLAARYRDDRGASRGREVDLVNVLLGVRHPAVFQAAESLLADASAPTTARLGAVAVLMRQWSDGLSIGVGELPLLLSGGLRECREGTGRAYGYFVRERLPADSAVRLTRVLTRADAAPHPGELRTLARCARERLHLAAAP